MWDFCLVNSSQSFLWNASLCLSLSLYRSLSLFSHARTHASDTSRSQCCMFPALSGPLQIILKSVDLTKALINGVLLALFLAHFQECWILSPSCRKKMGEKGQREKWQRERRGETEIFLFISGCKERTSGEVRGFKGSMFSVQGSESCGGKKCGLRGIYETFRRAPLKSFVIPYTHMHTGQLTHTHTHTHTYGKLCDVIDLSNLSISLVSISPTSFSVLCEALFFFFLNGEVSCNEWVNNQFLWTF